MNTAEDRQSRAWLAVIVIVAILSVLALYGIGRIVWAFIQLAMVYL